MIFLANTENVVQKSHLLRAMSSKVFTDLKAFDKLDFPLKQTLKIFPSEKGPSQKSNKTNSSTSNLTTDPNVLFDFKNLPTMQRAIGHD